MANAKLIVEFLPQGAINLKFDGIDGVTPGRLERVNLQARKELKRLCGVAGVEAAKRRVERKAAHERDLASDAKAKAETKAKAEAEAVAEQEDEDAEEEGELEEEEEEEEEEESAT